MKPAMYARLQVSRADMGIGITSEEQHLEEQHANGPHTRTAAIPGEDEFSDQGLDLEQKKRAEKNSQRIYSHGPQMWQSSSFNESLKRSAELHSAYGDRLTKIVIGSNVLFVPARRSSR